MVQAGRAFNKNGPTYLVMQRLQLPDFQWMEAFGPTATLPLPSKELFAALAIASTRNLVMSPVNTSIFFSISPRWRLFRRRPRSLQLYRSESR
jgi:hypothetical protein